MVSQEAVGLDLLVGESTGADSRLPTPAEFNSSIFKKIPEIERHSFPFFLVLPELIEILFLIFTMGSFMIKNSFEKS